VVLGTCPKCKEGEVRESPKAYGCSRYREGCNLTIWKKTAGKEISPKLAKDLLADGQTEHLEGFTSRAGKPFSARLKFDEEFKVVFEFENGPAGGAQRKPPEKRTSSSSDSGPSPMGAPPPLDAPPSDGAPPPMEEMPLSEGPPPSDPYPVPPAKAASAPSSDQEADFPQLGCPKCNEGHIVEGRKGFGCNRFREGCNFVVWKTVASKELTREQVETLIRDGKTDVIGGFKSRKGTTFETRLRLDEEWKTVFDFN